MTKVTNLQRIVGAIVEQKAGYPLASYMRDRIAAGESPERIAEAINEMIGVPGTKGVNGRTLRRWIAQLPTEEVPA